MGLELGQLHECEVQSVNDLVAVEVMHDVEVVDELVGVVVHERLVHEVERVDRLQQLVLSFLVELAHERL